MAWADGGTDDPQNLRTACEPCNLGKSDRSLRAATLEPLLATIEPGTFCPTRLYIAAIAVRFRVPYRTALGYSSGPWMPPPDRRDNRWMAIVEADEFAYGRMLADRMAELLNQKVA